MGILRLILALDIFFFHHEFTQSIALNPFLPVSIFFLISGFYMSLILNTKYLKQKNSLFLYTTNRFLRIYPLYWTILAIFILLTTIKYIFNLGTDDNAIIHYIAQYDSPPSQYWLLLTNFILRNITLLLNLDYFYESSKTAGYLLVQQAWTLQLELLFYLIAPFIVRLRKLSLLFITACYGLLYLATIILKTAIFPSLITSLIYYFIFFCWECGDTKPTLS